MEFLRKFLMTGMKMPPWNLTHSRQSFVFQGYLQENSIAVLPPPIPLFSVIISCLNSDSPTIFFLLLLLTCQICLSVCGVVGSCCCERIWRILQGPLLRYLGLKLILFQCRNCHNVHFSFHFKLPTHLLLTVRATLRSQQKCHSKKCQPVESASRSVTFPLWINYISDSNGGFFGPSHFR